MKLRPYRDSDIPELVSLVNENGRACYEFILHSEEDLRAELKRASCVLLAVDEQDRVAGLTYVHREWYGEAVTLHTQPRAEREDTENLLLSGIEREIQIGSLSASIDTLQPETLALFRTRGYGNESSFFQLVASLKHPIPLPQAPEGYLIRSLRPEEEETLIRLVNTAYNEERLRPGIMAKWKAEDPDFSTDWVQTAEYKGEPVAAVAAHTDRAFNEHYHACRAYLGPAATLPVHRGKGLTKGLTARAMQFLSDRGIQTVRLHTWEGNPPALAVARQLGFHLDHEWKILRKTLH